MTKQLLRIQSGDVQIEGELVVPDNSNGLVIFSHGSGSSRFSPRNNFVAQQLQRRKLATLLIDLLTREEDRTYSNRFDIALLARRLAEVTRYVQKLPATQGLPTGYFGASTGAASAIVAAANLRDKISAIVSRGGRPDLAFDSLSLVKAPTLLIVGSLDADVLKLNHEALDKIHAEKNLKIIVGASHLFEEPGTLETVAQLSTEWFLTHLMKRQSVTY